MGCAACFASKMTAAPFEYIGGNGASLARCRFPLLPSPAASAPAVQGMIGRGDALLALMGVSVAFHFGGGDDPHRAEPLGMERTPRDLSQERGAMETETSSGL